MVYAYSVVHAPSEWKDDIVQDALEVVCVHHLDAHDVLHWDTDEAEVLSCVNRATYRRQAARTRVEAPCASLDAIMSGELTFRDLARWLGKEDYRG